MRIVEYLVEEHLDNVSTRDGYTDDDEYLEENEKEEEEKDIKTDNINNKNSGGDGHGDIEDENLNPFVLEQNQQLLKNTFHIAVKNGHLLVAEYLAEKLKLSNVDVCLSFEEQQRLFKMGSIALVQYMKEQCEIETKLEYKSLSESDIKRDTWRSSLTLLYDHLKLVNWFQMHNYLSEYFDDEYDVYDYSGDGW